MSLRTVKLCVKCGQPLGTEPTQAHPSSSGIGYTKVHVQCPTKDKQKKEEK